MREFSAPLDVTVPGSGSLTDDVIRNAAEAPEAPLFARLGQNGCHHVSAAQFKADVEAVARGLLAAGIGHGERIALISRTRYEWTLLDYAVWWVGAVTVPLYPNSSAEQIGYILVDSGAVACVVETNEHARRVEQVRDRAPDLKHLWCIDEDAVAALVAEGQSVAAEELGRRRAAVQPHDLATVIYTSGTTGRPKGCMLTHGNFQFELSVTVAVLDELFATENASTLLSLPLAHVFARIVQVGCVRARVRMAHTADVKNLVDDLNRFRPTFVLGVPRVFEKVFNSASQKAHGEGRGRAFDTAVSTAIGYSRALDRGRVPPLLRVKHSLFDHLVYARLRDVLGGARYAVSGGAPLGEQLGHFFRGIGVTVLEGYGLTETTGALTVNRPGSTRVGTVGRPIPGTSVRVAEDGELLFRGGQVFTGYWRNERATEKAVIDGWLHTGDLGELDDEGYVRITGRKAEIVVTAGGKNVSPEPLEDAVRAHPLVSQCLVVGEARPFVAALVTLDREAVSEWGARHGKSGDLAAFVDDPDLRAEVQQAVDVANRAVSRAESIRSFRILPQEWTEESGHVTPTLKLKRSLVLRDFGDSVESLYR